MGKALIWPKTRPLWQLLQIKENFQYLPNLLRIPPSTPTFSSYWTLSFLSFLSFLSNPILPHWHLRWNGKNLHFVIESVDLTMHKIVWWGDRVFWLGCYIVPTQLWDFISSGEGKQSSETLNSARPWKKVPCRRIVGISASSSVQPRVFGVSRHCSVTLYIHDKSRRVCEFSSPIKETNLKTRYWIETSYWLNPSCKWL